MIGSEYNWLVSFTRAANGAPKISLARTGFFTLAVAVFCFLCIALHAGPETATSPRLMGPPALAGDSLHSTLK